MLRLISYPGGFGAQSASPFCVKAINMMNLSGLPWQIEYTNDPRKTPMQKLPVLVDGDETIADSNIIRTHLEEKHGVAFDNTLSDSERAQSHALIRMLEENLYFLLMHDRWLDDRNWPLIRNHYFREIPTLVRGFITGRLRKEVQHGLKVQGTGRFTDLQRFERAVHDIEAVRLTLGKKDYLFQDHPTFADCSASAMLRAISVSPVETKLSSFMNEQADIMAYVERCEAVFGSLPNQAS